MLPGNHPGTGARGELDLFDVISLAWSERGFIALLFAVIFAVGAMASWYMLTPTYEAQSRLLILLENDPTPTAAGTGGAFELNQIMESESALLGSEAVRRLTVEHLGADVILGERTDGDATDAAMRVMAGSFSISREPNSSALIASYEADRSGDAALILNTIVDTYLAYRQEILVESGADALAERRRLADIAVEDARGALDAFLAANSISSFETERDAAETSVTALQDRLRTARADRDAAEAGAAAIEARLSDIPESVELYVENGASTLLLDRRVERQRLLARYQPSAPPVVAIDREIAAIEELIAAGGTAGLGQRRTGANPVRQALETDLATRAANAGAEANRVDVLQRQLTAAQNDVARLRSLEAAYTQLAQTVTATEEISATLAGQEAVAAARRSMGSGAADSVRVFDRATPPTQSSSLKKLGFIAAFVLAAGVSLCAGLLRAYWKAYIASGYGVRPARRPGAARSRQARYPAANDAVADLPVLARIADRSV